MPARLFARQEDIAMKRYSPLASVFVAASLLFSSLSEPLRGTPDPTPVPPAPGAPQRIAAASTIYLPLVSRPAENEWPMPGANPQRTSWTPEEVSGQLRPLWYRQFESYINPRFQIIAANNMLYISTANGLYAIDAQTGADRWVFPTRLPLGNSPTVKENVVYVGGFDHKLYALNAQTGAKLWHYEAGFGFDTNPLVVDGLVLLGNRDGYFYAIHAAGTPQQGTLAWRYQTGGPIHFSAAYKDGVVYFASDDGYAYALRASDGGLVWKSSKLPGAGFMSWWPVVYRDWVIFPGSLNYRENVRPGDYSIFVIEEGNDVFPNRSADPRGTLVGPLGTAAGDWVANTPTIDASRSEVTRNGRTTPVTEYLESKPWRRTYFVLNRSNGSEYTTDFDHDGRAEYAPLLWHYTHSGNRYPPVVGADGVLYQATDYMSDPWIPGGHIAGWKIGTPYLSVVSSVWMAVDEVLSYSAGGNMLYWTSAFDAEAGTINIRIPNRLFAERYTAGIRPPTDAVDFGREWRHWLRDLEYILPNYYTRYYDPGRESPGESVFGSRNGVYGIHGNQNPPIPYKGKLYVHRSNAVMAFTQTSASPTQLPLATIRASAEPDPTLPTREALRARLESEVSKMIAAGHLRPGYHSTGLYDLYAHSTCGDTLIDYWHNASDTILALLAALPHLSPSLQTQVRAYLQNEMTNYPPYVYNQIGWNTGAAREDYLLPQEVLVDLPNLGPQWVNYNFIGWDSEQYTFYALWKYAQEFGGARNLFDLSKDNIEHPPADSVLLEMPHIHNGFIAGYQGYLALQAMAGYPETAWVRQELNRLLQLRASTFTLELPQRFFTEMNYVSCRALSGARNFLFMSPELAQYLRQNALARVTAAVTEFERVAPYWFVSKFDVTFHEGTLHPLFDYHAIFQAKAQILNQSFAQLAPYLDAPATPRGDLYFIQNLVTLLQLAPPAGASEP
jgi:outer membrane protein assembly factor BamB